MFSNRYELKGPDPGAIRSFFRHEILQFLEAQEVPFQLESNGTGLLLFADERLLNPDEVRILHAVGCGLVACIFPPKGTAL